jgi:hypothetical protein
MSLRRFPRLLVLASALAAAAGCGPTDNLTAFDVEVTIFSDCSQTASSAPQCGDEEELRSTTRFGRWYIEDLGGANALIPLSQFILTDDQGRSVTGIHFVDNGAITETDACTGSGGECYFARTQVDEANPDDPENLPENRCKTFARAYDFKVDLDGTLNGLWQDVQLENEVCSTPFVGQVLAEVSGTRVDEEVIAREGAQ